MKYLSLFDFLPEAVYAPKNFVHRHAGYPNKDWDEFSKLKCIVTARDPYLCGLRFISNGQTLEECAYHWDKFFDTYESIDHFILDIGVREEDRLEHLCQVADFIGVWPNKYKAAIREYANGWIPVKGTSNEHKKRYIESGILPTNYDWQILDRAVAWYKNLPTNDYS